MAASGRWIRRGAVVLAVLVVASALVLHLTAWHRLPCYALSAPIHLGAPLLTDAEFDAVSATFPRPYVVEVETKDAGGVLVYGAEHTRDAGDPEIADIRAHWKAFRPTVALVESRLGILFPWFMDPVATFCEPGEVYALSLWDEVPAYSWEPDEAQILKDLLAVFPPERVALLLVLRPYFSGLRFGRPSDPEGFVAEYLERAEQPGLEGTLGSVADIDAIWKRDSPVVPDGRDTSDEFGLPGYLADVAARANAARTRHLAEAVVDLARQGEFVFAVAGSSHAVKIDRAVRASLADLGVPDDRKGN